MVLYLDTCTVLNLLQINYDDEYLKYLEKIFDEVKLTPKVFEELRVNKFANVVDSSNKQLLDEIIFGRIKGYIDGSDYNDSLEFTKKNNDHCFKENGESHTVSYALKFSRFGNIDFGENILKTHFATDDTPATNDFITFYKINIVGQVLNSIDLMTLFWLKKHISKNDVLKYCLLLKQLYNKDVGILLAEIRDYSTKFAGEINSKQRIVITQLVDVLSDIDEQTNVKLLDIIKFPEIKSILNKNKSWQKLIDSICNSNFREKIPYINKRISDINMVWELV